MVTRRQIDRLAAFIAEQFRPARIVLFGSHAYGSPSEQSDVDLLVVTPVTRESVLKTAGLMYVAIDEAKVAPFPFDLIVRTPAQLRQRVALGGQFIHEILEKGQVLYEGAHNR